MLTLVVRPPKTAEALRRNPLGIFVNAIDWARELDPPTSAAPASSVTQPAQPVQPMAAPVLSPDSDANPAPDSTTIDGGNVQ